MKTNEKVLLNAIIGDICGSIYEFSPIKEKPENLINPLCNFTDDTVHTIAIADAILKNPEDPDFASSLREWSNRYPLAGYGGRMCMWLDNPEMGPYNSFGNGSAMRVSACGWMKDSHKELSKRSAEVTHNHDEGIKGAKVVGSLIHELIVMMNTHDSINGWWRNDIDKIKSAIPYYIQIYYPNYILSRSLDERRPSYEFDETCQGTVPVAIQCVLEAESYEDAIKLAISMGGDADTMACIAGSIAGVIWDKPDELVEFAYKRLPKKMIEVVEEFDKLIESK